MSFLVRSTAIHYGIIIVIIIIIIIIFIVIISI